MKKRGFTLIELLAVILVLGIIALIAIPILNNIIKESKKGAFETTVNNMVSVIENTCQLQTLKGETITETYTFDADSVSPSLNLKGSLPTNGTAIVDLNCNVIISVTNGVFTATKLLLSDNVIVTAGEDLKQFYSVYANGTPVYFNPVTGGTCTVGEAVSTTETKTGCMKWYAFNDGGVFSNTINLILDHNTTAKLAWNSTASNVNGPINVLTQLASDTSSWAGVPTRTDSYSVSNGTATYTINYGTYKARLLTAAEIATITGNNIFSEETSRNSNWFYFDSNNQTQTVTTVGASNYDWLFDYTTSCTNYGCNIADASTWGYWTSTAISGSSYHAWSVKRDGVSNGGSVERVDFYGVRPVITIPKSNL